MSIRVLILQNRAHRRNGNQNSSAPQTRKSSGNAADALGERGCFVEPSLRRRLPTPDQEIGRLPPDWFIFDINRLIMRGEKLNPVTVGVAKVKEAAKPGLKCRAGPNSTCPGMPARTRRSAVVMS